jgi:hypothetical protein
MGGRESFQSAFLDWLAMISGRIEALQSGVAEDGLSQSWSFASELWRLRRECEVLQRSLEALVLNGQLGHGQKAGTFELLHDLRWLLEISPSAPPALARQCLRIAQDRIAEEADVLCASARSTSHRAAQLVAVA